MSTLPIYALEEDLNKALQQKPHRVLIQAPTGSGKSTGVPPMLVRLGWSEQGRILIIQPRRIAARMLAQRVAQIQKTSVGQEVGYTVRFDNKTSTATKIQFMTDGLLERLLLENPTLAGISAIIFDEFHERRLSSDLCLARVLNIQETTRPDLALIVMSATLEVEGLSSYLAPCTTLKAEGKMYPVEVFYRPLKPSTQRGLTTQQPLWEAAYTVAKEAILNPTHGDILIFMPGSYEISRCLALLENDKAFRHFDLYALHGQLSPDKQTQAISPSAKDKIIVSTNIAETSLTIEGLRTVIDTGLARLSGRDTRRELDTLTLQKISKASAQQRLGRAGRMNTGRCYRLWSEADHNRRQDFETPEVLRVEISPAVLALSHWGYTQPTHFRWLTAPSAKALDSAQNLLFSLKALTSKGELTPLGKKLLRYPLAPRLARLILAGQDHQCTPELAFIAAVIQGENILKPGDIPSNLHDPSDYTDFQVIHRALLKAEKHHYDLAFCRTLGISARACREVRKSYEQLLRLSSGSAPLPFIPEPDWTTNQIPVTQALLDSYADHIGVRRSIATNTCRLVGGKNGKLPSGTAAYKDLTFIATEASEIEGKTLETHISLCTTIPLELISTTFPQECTTQFIAEYNEIKRRVFRKQQTIFRDLILVDQEKGEPSPEEAAPILAKKVADGTLKLKNWDDTVEQWITRLKSLRIWMPELELPSFNEEDHLVALNLICEKALGYKDIKDRPVMPILKEWLSPWQNQALDQYAPTKITLSNGQSAKIRYDDQGIPHIALTAQRLFGVLESPKIAMGAATVTIEILAPNQRPWQVTGDLKNFWITGFPQMKKDLAARYPKHKWTLN